MKGLKIIPHSTLNNANIKNLAKALHQPKPYTERYNFSCIDKIMEEGKQIKLKQVIRKDLLKKIFEAKDENTNLLILQNNFVYEIEITNKNIEFRLLNQDLENVKKIYSKYIDKIKFSKENYSKK